jgi:hypothetical protein
VQQNGGNYEDASPNSNVTGLQHPLVVTFLRLIAFPTSFLCQAAAEED